MTRGEMNWKIVRSIIPIIAMIFFVYYTKNLKTDYTKLNPILKTSAHDILWRFQMNEGEKFLYNVIQIDGNITKVDSSDFILHYKIICTPEKISGFSFTEGKKTTIKGRCIRYDPITENLLLDHVIEVKN
tara:strand:+ start:1151 stop:1540 length:390 start_codon:yes stop_codon:yes gene_type:complete